MEPVIDIDSHRPHFKGEAVCLHCDHHWIAVAPAGTITGLECPECRTHRGIFDYGFGAGAGQSRLLCIACECDLFYIRPNGVHCHRCGQHVTVPIEDILSAPKDVEVELEPKGSVIPFHEPA